MLSELVTTVSRGMPHQGARDLGRRGAPGEADRGALAHPGRGLACDPSLLLAKPRAAVAQRQLVQHPLADRAAVRAGEQLLILEQPQIAPDCRRRHAQVGRELADADAARAGQPLEDGGETVGLAHFSSLPCSRAQSCCLLIDICIESSLMSVTEAEIATQPDNWLRARTVAKANQHLFPAAGERVAVVGCGTSWYMACAYAAARERSGLGETDAFAASESALRAARYDRLIAISRSGTTTEVVRLLADLPAQLPSLVITGVDGSPVTSEADATVLLDYADEQSVVQTRFATTALVLLRASLGITPDDEAAAAALALEAPLPDGLAGFRRIVFLGEGWTIGLASEAALKIREAAGAWTESYPAMEYRHGPISAASDATLVWPIGDVDPTVLDAAVAAGSTIAPRVERPLASLVLAQRAAVALARARGLDPDRPLNLTRSVVLP